MAERRNAVGPWGVLLGAVGLFAVLWGVPSGVGAQDRHGRRQHQPRVVTLDEIVIEGQVQKPNAFYILNRSNIGYEVLDLRTSFLQEIVRSVQQEPF